jgi:hypothetical protein
LRRSAVGCIRNRQKDTLKLLGIRGLDRDKFAPALLVSDPHLIEREDEIPQLAGIDNDVIRLGLLELLGRPCRERGSILFQRTRAADSPTVAGRDGSIRRSA